jgi:hypothetical protein
MSSRIPLPLSRVSEAEVLDADEQVPPELRPTEWLWRDDPRCRVVVMPLLGRWVPYVGLWPPDADPPPPTGLSIDDLDGVVLTEPAHLLCFSCRARFVGLTRDGGMPFFRDRGRHEWLRGCTSCGADFSTSRLLALKLAPERDPTVG